MAINLPPDIEKQAQEAAARQGVDTDAFVTTAVKNELRALVRAADEAAPFEGSAAPLPPKESSNGKRVLTGRGLFKGLLSSTEELIREKQEELDREERRRD